MGDVYRVFVKGAPEKMVRYCSTILGENGKVQEFDEAGKDHAIGTVVTNFAKKQFRTLAVAYRDFSENEWSRMGSPDDKSDIKSKVQVEDGLTMVGIFGLKDTIRKGVRQAIETCHKAGINVRMLTGDNIQTARAIALEVGIIAEADLSDPEEIENVCMEGNDFRYQVGGEVNIEET